MAADIASQSSRPHPRRWLGVRRVPGRLALVVFRAPLWLYRHDKGWTLGRTFLMLEHTGRKTGRPHQTVAMVLADNPDTGELVIVSGWGPDADWLLNLRAGPAREVRVGHDRFAPVHRILDEDEATAVAKAFVQRHPRRAWLISTILGWGDLRDDAVLSPFVQGHPLVGLSPIAYATLRSDERGTGAQISDQTSSRSSA